jgi:hypothetical protein
MIKTLSALLVPTIALLGTYIAWQQYVTNRRQYRLALFEKRLAVFDATARFLSGIVQTANVQLDDAIKFLQETREHEFLFGPEVAACIDAIYTKAVELHTRRAAVGPGTGAPVAELVKWFSGQIGNVRKKCKPHMDFTKP